MTLIFIGYFAAIFMGITLGMMGAGGSILTVPILVYLFQLPASTATFYSLFIVGLSALLGFIKYYKNRLFDFKKGLFFLVPSTIGVLVSRNFILPLVPESVRDMAIMVVFSVLMISAAYAMIKKTAPAPKMHQDNLNQLLKLSAKALPVGLVTGFVGAGGGFLIIPALVFLAGLEMKRAVGTSLAIIAINLGTGFSIEVHRHNQIDWKLLASFSILSVIGIFIGTYFSQTISDQKLKKAFGWFILILGSFLLLDQIF